jgi:methionyl-tRNA synthetase
MEEKNKYYITTAIPYVNAKLHIGNVVDWLCADILARHHRSLGEEVMFSLGADQHGEKNLEKAQEAGLDPKVYVDGMADKFNDIFEAYNIRPDRFIKTSDEAHKQRVQIIWDKLKPHIYKGKYVGAYCVGCEEFKTETHVKETNGICPDHDRKYDQLEEENYFFRFSDFTEQVRSAIESDEIRIVPESKKKEALNLIGDGMEDMSVARPKSRVGEWGVEVPDDPEYIVYVWFEAVMNYITLLGYPENEDFKKFWPADVQVLGKGVLRFHALTWPGILLALGLPLPHNLYVHGYWNMNGRELSKTTGNVAYPEDLAAIYGSDATRYFNARYLPSYKDGDFTWLKTLNVYNDDLVNGLGNVIQRTAKMVDSYLKGELGDDVPGPHHDNRAYYDALKNYRFDKALEWAFEIVNGVNRYLEQTKPWMLVKEDKNAAHVKEILLNCVSDILEIGTLLAPFMPKTADMIEEMFSGQKMGILSGPVFAKVELPGELTAQAEVKKG